jgi:hypothetical protein
VKFRIRAHDPKLFVGNPGGLVLEITRGNMTDSFALTLDDLAALSALSFHWNAGQPLPIETGER